MRIGCAFSVLAPVISVPSNRSLGRSTVRTTRLQRHDTTTPGAAARGGAHASSHAPHRAVILSTMQSSALWCELAHRSRRPTATHSRWLRSSTVLYGATQRMYQSTTTADVRTSKQALPVWARGQCSMDVERGLQIPPISHDVMCMRATS